MRAFRIVVAGHGGLAPALLASAALVCGTLEDAAAVALEPADTPEAFAERLAAACGDGGRTRPLLLLTDLAGGTPHNLAVILARGLPLAHVVAGANLPLLVEAITSIADLDAGSVARLVLAGRDGLTATAGPAGPA